MRARKLGLLTALGLVLGAVLFLSTALAAPNWGSPFVLGSGTLYPTVAIDARGTQYYAWVTRTGALQYTQCTGQNALGCAPATTIATVGAAFFPALALDLQGRPNLVWDSRVGETQEYQIFWTRLNADGWLYPKQLSNQFHSEAPAIAIGPQGIIHIVYQSKDPSGKTGYVNYIESTNGTNFRPALVLPPATAPSIPAAPLALGFNPRVAVDSHDRAHVVWNLATAPYGIEYRYQTASGWSDPLLVGTGHKDQTADIAINNKDVAAIVWSRYDDFNSQFATYAQGQRVSGVNELDLFMGQSLRPRLTADCAGNFHIVYQGSVNADGHWNIYQRLYNPAANVLFGRDTITALSGTQEQTPQVAATNRAAIVYNNSTDGLALASVAATPIACQ